MIGLNLFKKVYTADQLARILDTFDQETATLQAQQLGLSSELETALAQAAVGEIEPKALKALQAEAAEISRKLTGRSGARAKIENELQVRQAEEARTARLAKIKEARAWAARMSTATDDLIGALRIVTEKLTAMRRIDAEMPNVIVTERPNIAPPVGGWLARFRWYLEPDQFGPAVATLEGHKALLDQTIRDIEAGAITAWEHLEARMKAEMAPRETQRPA